MPDPERRKSRRETPWALACLALRASRRASNSFCWGVWGGGMNSSLEAIRVGIGDGASTWASRSHLRTHMAGPRRREGQDRFAGGYLAGTGPVSVMPAVVV